MSRIHWHRYPGTVQSYDSGQPINTQVYRAEYELPEGPVGFTLEPIFRWAQRGPNSRVRDGWTVRRGDLKPVLTADGRQLFYRRFDTLAEAKTYCERRLDDVITGKIELPKIREVEDE